MEENKKVKLRVLNGHTDSFALHIHGHKPMATHYDGVDNGPSSYIKRDVHGMVPAQRLDLELSGVDDGLNSFGPGVWMFHDHVEKSFTTNGIGEGGDISLVVYKGFADERGIPQGAWHEFGALFHQGILARQISDVAGLRCLEKFGIAGNKSRPRKKRLFRRRRNRLKADTASGCNASQTLGGGVIQLFYGLLLGILTLFAVLSIGNGY